MSDEITRQMFLDIQRGLRQPTEPKLIKTREGHSIGGGRKAVYKYIEWFNVAEILDEVAGDWSTKIVRMDELGGCVYCVVSLTIADVTREGIGTSDGAGELGIKAAESDGLKRAAVKFGIGRDLYNDDDAAPVRASSSNNRTYGTDGIGQSTNPKPYHQQQAEQHRANGAAKQSGGRQATQAQIALLEHKCMMADVLLEDFLQKKGFEDLDSVMMSDINPMFTELDEVIDAVKGGR